MRRIHEMIKKLYEEHPLKLLFYDNYTLLEEPGLTLTEESACEGWGDEVNTIKFTGYIRGNLFKEGLTDCNNDEYGLSAKVFAVELKIPDDILNEVKENRNNLSYYLLMHDKEFGVIKTTEILMSVDKFMENYMSW